MHKQLSLSLNNEDPYTDIQTNATFNLNVVHTADPKEKN